MNDAKRGDWIVTVRMALPVVDVTRPFNSTLCRVRFEDCTADQARLRAMESMTQGEVLEVTPATPAGGAGRDNVG